MINFSGSENISNLIELEKVSLESTLNIQRNLNKQVLIFMKKFMANVDISSDKNPDDKTFFYLDEANTILNRSNSNIGILTGLIDCLNNIDILGENLANELSSYNESFKTSFTSIFSNTEIIERFIYEITLNDISDFQDTNTLNLQVPENYIYTTPIYDTIADNSTSEFSEKAKILSKIPENTLIISETQITLPYNLDKVQEILENNARFHSIEEVVTKFYTKPISYYKFSPIARFKEAYKLVKEKEKGSRIKALSLAFELLGNYTLHPAIITACKSIDELDIYLACLDENALDDFKFFNIKYEIPLTISTK